jgi:putative hydrolase of the HAD superfamily
MLTTPIHTLIFDLDNTLIDRNAALRCGLQFLLKTLGYCEPELQTALEHSMQRDNWGYTSREEFCSWFLHTYGKGEVKRLTPGAFLKVLQVLIVQRIQPEPSIHQLLHSLTGHFRLVLASNGSSKTQRAKLGKSELDAFFQPEAIFISGEMDCEKPDPVFFKMIIRQLHLDPGSTMVIGDNLNHDIEAAAVCGLHTCWVSHGRENTTGIRPHQVITNITETAKWSKQLI